MTETGKVMLNGAAGEGGGQMLRSALALSLFTGRPLEMVDIRGGRKRPGLLRQHLTALRLAAEIGSARVEGDTLGSTAITFVPQGVRTGAYHAAVGTAGSAVLVAQTVLPALMMASGPSTLTLAGGTHNMAAPPFEFLDRVYLPALRAMGLEVDASLERAGFYPAGGGIMTLRVTPGAALRPLALLSRGAILRRGARILIAGIPGKIAKRERDVLQARLGWPDDALEIVTLPQGWGPGNIVLAEVEAEGGAELFSAVGRRGVRAEAVAGEVADALDAHLAADVPVGAYLADQLLLPMAIVGSGRFVTGPPSTHTRTNAEVIARFLPVSIALNELGPGRWEINVASAG